MAKQKIPTLVGISGYSQGERFPLQYGKTLVIGRSRSADFSLRRLKKYLSLPIAEREKDEMFRTVSGRHFEITMYNLGAIEVKNLSGNGTLVDGEPIETLVIEDIDERAYKIEIGLREKFSLEMAEHDVDRIATADAAEAVDEPDMDDADVESDTDDAEEVAVEEDADDDQELDEPDALFTEDAVLEKTEDAEPDESDVLATEDAVLEKTEDEAEADEGE